MELTGLTEKQVDACVAGLSKLMQQSVNTAFSDATSSMLASDDVIVASPIDSLGALVSSWKTSVATKLMPYVKNIFTTAASTVVSQLGVAAPLDEVAPVLDSVQESLTAYANDLYDAGYGAVMIGWQDGETIGAMATRLGEVPKQKLNKTHSIAQTLVTATVNGGEWEQLLAIAATYNAITTKEWVATHDSHTRPTHEAADGQIVPLGAKFSVGNALLDFPGDPFGDLDEIVNCRCTTKYDAEIQPQNSSPQTSPDALSADSAVDTTEQISASAATNSNWSSSDHPRGKDGRFIKKGSGAFNAITKIGKNGKNLNTWTTANADSFVSDVKSLDQKEWDNLTEEQKYDIETVIGDAVEAGIPGSAAAQLNVDALGIPEANGNDDVDLFDPDTPLPESSNIAAVVNDIDDAYGEGKITAAQKDNLLKMSKSGVNADDLQEALDEDVASNTTTPTPSVVAPSLSTAPITTGSLPKEVKITHGLIHAKHAPGTIIAVSEDGHRVTWNGSSYDIIDDNGDVVVENIKKSKLYALLNDYYPGNKWHESGGKQETEVSHATPLDAAPPANPIPHPVAGFPAPSAVDTALDDAFGATNTGLASPSIPAVSQGTDMSKWKQVGGQAGSNKGALFEAPDGKRYYVKSLKSKEHAQNEVLAAALYRAAGINVPEVRHVTTGAPPGWNNVIASPIVPNAKNNKKGLTTPGKFHEQAQQTFAVTAWLANFDAVGLTHDNMIESDGQVHLIDVGGSMGYRAQGQKKKASDWNEDPTSALEGLRNPSTNPQAASVFGGMTYAQQRESAKALLGITDAQIDQMVADAGLPPKQAAILKARRDAILKLYGLDENNASIPNVPMPTPVLTPMPVVTSVDESNLPELVPGGAISPTEIIENASDFAVGEVVATGIDEDGYSWTVSHAPGGYLYMQVENSGVQTVSYPSFLAQSSNNLVSWTASDGSTSLLPGPSVAKKTTPTAFGVPFPSTLSTLSTPSTPSTPSSPAMPTQAQQAAFYKHFKAEGVSPAWSGAKIYKSMQAAKLKMSGDPAIANLTDAQMLEILDKQHNLAKATNVKAYSTKTKEWLKTPQGQKAFKEANSTTPTLPPSVAKKVLNHVAAAKTAGKKLASSSVNKPTDELAGPKGIAHLTPAQQEGLFNAFKNGDANGKYLKHYAKDIFYNAVQQAKANPGISPMQVLQAVDAQSANNLGVPNNNSFESKVQDWLDKSSVNQVNTVYNDALLSGTGTAAKKASAKKAPAKKYGAYYGSPSYGGTSAPQHHAHAASEPLNTKVQDISGTVPPFDPNLTSADFPTINNSQAATLWSDMITQSGQSFSPKQKASLRHYTTNTGFSNMNTYLRGQSGASVATQTHVNNAQAGMRPTTENIVLHRGQGSFTDGAGRHWGSYDEISQYVGTNLHQQAFFSASVGGKADFSGSIKMEIEVPKGTPAAYVKAFSAYKKSESEMLLAANMEYRIISAKQVGGQTVVRMRVVPKGSA